MCCMYITITNNCVIFHCALLTDEEQPFLQHGQLIERG